MCHHGYRGASAAFSLLPEDAIDNLVDQPVTSDVDVSAEARIVAGEPENSAVYALTVGAYGLGRQDGDLTRMPPVGVFLGDLQWEELLTGWITELADHEDDD
jgi:hypothetical protein